MQKKLHTCYVKDLDVTRGGLTMLFFYSSLVAIFILFVLSLSYIHHSKLVFSKTFYVISFINIGVNLPIIKLKGKNII